MRNANSEQKFTNSGTKLNSDSRNLLSPILNTKCQQTEYVQSKFFNFIFSTD